MTASSTASAPRTRLRRFAPGGLVVVGVLMLIGVLAAWTLLPSLSLPSSQVVGWKLDYGYNGHGFDPTTAQTTSVVPIEVNRPDCAPGDASWLAAPVIAYTPWAVIITMHMTDTFSESTKCVAHERDSRLPLVGNYLSGDYYPVHLSEPLGGRALFDGAKFPPAARPYP
jgi:hypothetical protein